MVINTNLSAQNAAQSLVQSSSRLSQSLARLSSGSKIISPADDSAGLAVSMKMGAEITRTDAANNNIANALSFSQTQDGYLNKVNDALNRMSELSVLAQDATKTNSDRSLYNTEFQSLNTYINDVKTKDFNGVSLFSSSGLNVSLDGEGGALSMPGISANYVTPGVTTTNTTTSLVGYSANTLLGTVNSAFAGNPNVGWLGAYSNGGSSYSFNTVQPTNTIGDLVTALNSTGGRTNAAYNATTGQLSITVGTGNYLISGPGGPSGNGSLLANLGFTGLNSFGPGPFGEIDINNQSGSSPVTESVYLNHSVSTTTTTTTGTMDISMVSGAASALTQIKSSITQLATDRASIGANMERLSYNSDQLSTLKNNLSAAKSRITDVDVAAESTNYARNNILVQAGTSMLAQANSLPQSVLKLLG